MTSPVAKSSKTKKPATKASTVGQTLKTKRLSRGLSLADVELATRIRGKYLVAIEADDYQTLPQDIYTRGFIQSYADFLKLDGIATAKIYTEERGQQNSHQRRSTGVSKVRFVLTPRLLTVVGGSLAVVAVVVYLILQFQDLTAPPQLVITNPSHDQVLYGSLITVSGNAGDGADVYVNSSPILVDGSGNFTDQIALQNGVNNINVSAKNALGKTTTVTRNILAHVPQTDPNSVLPTAPFNGVAVSVQVQSKATTIDVIIDGNQKFSGTMLPGTTQTFKGNSSVTIATTDGGATSVTVTNSVVAGKSLGALGRNGEAVSDFEFTTDTQFQ
ncbi:MAG TPA: helix-turn-helix domain-containing protein [Candidatus Saccharimonadales bacterium]|nr:helix-turn-helix domain-containing protein [Candidatus Saccharimonadales bacterium]